MMYQKEEQTKLYPGDKDYPGGIFTTRVYSKGKNLEITTHKDANGNITSVYTRDLLFGIF